MKNISTASQKARLLGFALLFLVFGCAPEGKQEANQDEQNLSPETALNLPMKSLSFIHQEDTVTVQVPVNPDLAKAEADAPHEYTYQSALPPNWREDYYAQFLSFDQEAPMVRALLAELRRASTEKEGDAFAEFVISFVQGAITYDWQTFSRLDESTMRYPWQTMEAGTGVCADKTLLLARLLGELGYEVAIFTFDRANHMALGIAVPSGLGDYGTRYAYVEATGYAPVGQIPDRFVGGIRLEGNPEVVELGKVFSGANQSFQKIIQNRRVEVEWVAKYGREYLFYDPQQRKLKREMTELGEEIDALRKETKHCQGTLSQAQYAECKEKVDLLNGKVEVYNALVAEFNAIAGRSGGLNQV